MVKHETVIYSSRSVAEHIDNIEGKKTQINESTQGSSIWQIKCKITWYGIRNYMCLLSMVPAYISSASVFLVKGLNSPMKIIPNELRSMLPVDKISHCLDTMASHCLKNF